MIDDARNGEKKRRGTRDNVKNNLPLLPWPFELRDTSSKFESAAATSKRMSLQNKRFIFSAASCQPVETSSRRYFADCRDSPRKRRGGGSMGRCIRAREEKVHDVNASQLPASTSSAGVLDL